MYYSTAYMSPVGLITLASDGDSLVGLWFEGQKYYGGLIRDLMTAGDDVPVFGTAKEWLDMYFAGGNPGISMLPLAPIGSEFRQRVWDCLCEIPYGQVVTYGDIAARVADKTDRKVMSARAVGGAVGHNPISIIIPCHRVVGAGGKLTGYAAGVDVKARLLRLEGVDCHVGFTSSQ